jgi:hypothetical protein
VATAVLAGALLGAPSAGEDRSIAFLNSGMMLPAGLPFSEAVRVGNTHGYSLNDLV